jgi:hypothetical protein
MLSPGSFGSKRNIYTPQVRRMSLKWECFPDES